MENRTMIWTAAATTAAVIAVYYIRRKKKNSPKAKMNAVRANAESSSISQEKNYTSTIG